ncbi:MAG: HAMP domain-containing protein [Armatimonadetes bacterium]|nr:HAMP domain-containing protein [Armatimonadota bacterium]
MSLSLRGRLTLWFGLVMALSIGIFSTLTYTSVSNELRTSLDLSLERMISSIVLMIRTQGEKGGEGKQNTAANTKTRPQTDTAKDVLQFLRDGDSLRQDSLRQASIQPPPKQQPAEAEKIVWTEIYEHIVLNPRNSLIQVMDTAGAIVFRSKNLGADSLHIEQEFLRLAVDTIPRYTTIYQAVIDTTSGPQPIRIAAARTRSAIIIVAYPRNEVQSILEQLFSTLLLLAPVVLLFSVAGGFFLAKTSLRQVDAITRTAKEITASNLSRRLPVPNTSDEISRLSDTLNDMISRLESSFERTKQFSADASHELRTPLTILTGEMELALRSRKTPTEYQDVISSALQEVLRLSRVVESLLMLSRTDGGKLSLHREPTNLTDMLADLADAASILGGAKSIYITFRANEDLTIDADRPKLYQVFLNLVDNAVKYTPEGGMISLTIHRDKNVAEVRVRDTGIGISSEHQKKIFDRFYRVDKARSREMGGVGLGLSIVQWTVQAHDGEIRVESEPGQGSTFVVRLPLLNPTPQNEDMGITPPRHRTLAQTFDVKRLLKKPKGSSDEKKPRKDPAAEEAKAVEEPEAKQG